MRTMLLVALASAAVLVQASDVQGQEPYDHGAHGHGLGKLGKVTFPVSCTDEAEVRFEQAMAVLHSFWWEEGDAAFSRVLEADPDCAMAHWGVAMNAWGNPFAGGPSEAGMARGSEAAAMASSRFAETPRERGFIAAAAALYRDAGKTSNAARLQAYADTMARMYRDFPKDTEVSIFYALSLIATAPKTDTTFAQQKRAAAILNPLFAKYPQHPGLAHYIIHSTDSPQLARLGLSAARRYARIAPAAPHAQHMPSHIFIRLGYWDENVASNRVAFQAGVDNAEAKGVPPAGEVLHALDYAVYGYLQRGQDSAARATVEIGKSAGVPEGKSLVGDYNRTAMAARIPMETGDWKAAAEFPVAEMQGVGTQAMLSRFTRAIGSARSGDTAAARAEVAELDSIAAQIAEKKEPYWARVAAIKRDAARAWLMFAAGDTAGALALAREAADSEEVTDKHPVTPAELLPARELLGDMLLEAKQYKEAGEAYRATLVREPGRARSLFGSARAAELAGDRAKAKAAYREFLKLMSKADGGRPELATARKMASP
ncbi:MAG TPA: bacterial transcriptional activator domain-containing protein [Gemmatimonadales bacterium]